MRRGPVVPAAVLLAAALSAGCATTSHTTSRSGPGVSQPLGEPAHATKGAASMKRYLIDRFVVPAGGRAEFLARMKLNRAFVERLPGLAESAAYERTDEAGNGIYVTVAAWESEAALTRAKAAAQAEFTRTGFDMKEMVSRLGIVLDRGTYEELSQER